MSISQSGRKGRGRILLVAGMVILAGFVVGTMIAGFPEARAEVRTGAPRSAFQSGAARNEATLREIAAILRRIDGRLERIEQVAQRVRHDQGKN